jgi:subtilisin-like proprotein convertase family protein
MTRRFARAGFSTLVVFALCAVAGTPALAKTKTKTATFSQCITPGTVLPDQGAGSAVLNVPVPKNGRKLQNGVVSGVQTGIRISHQDSNDLDLALVSPGGRAIALASEEVGPPGNLAAGYGTGAGCSGSLATFGDAFSTPIADNSTPDGQPITGQFQPRQPLAAFNGGPARGPWVLLVSDCCTGEVGVIDGFSLNVTYTYKVPVKKKKKGKK